jgi:hypothetical protein
MIFDEGTEKNSPLSLNPGYTILILACKKNLPSYSNENMQDGHIMQGLQAFIQRSKTCIRALVHAPTSRQLRDSPCE